MQRITEALPDLIPIRSTHGGQASLPRLNDIQYGERGGTVDEMTYWYVMSAVGTSICPQWYVVLGLYHGRHYGLRDILHDEPDQ